VLQAQQDLRESKDPPESQVLLALKVQLVQRVSQGPPDQRGRQERRV